MSAGKGSTPRPVDPVKWDAGYSAITWPSTKEKEKPKK